MIEKIQGVIPSRVKKYASYPRIGIKLISENHLVIGFMDFEIFNQYRGPGLPFYLYNNKFLLTICSCTLTPLVCSYEMFISVTSLYASLISVSQLNCDKDQRRANIQTSL